MIENGDSQHARFQFPAFRFIEQQNQTISTYYLHCITRLCERSTCSQFKVRLWGTLGLAGMQGSNMLTIDSRGQNDHREGYLGGPTVLNSTHTPHTKLHTFWVALISSVHAILSTFTTAVPWKEKKRHFIPSDHPGGSHWLSNHLIASNQNQSWKQ